MTNTSINLQEEYNKTDIKKVLDRNGKLMVWADGELSTSDNRTIYFAKNSIKVTALDYSPTAVKIIEDKSSSLGLSDFINVQTHDLRKKLKIPIKPPLSEA